jgi:hypothetical protein
MIKFHKRPLPTDSWLVSKLIEGSSEAYKIIAELDKKEKVIIKVSIADDSLEKHRYDDRNEYRIYQLLDKIKQTKPNIPKVYGQMHCYEKKRYIDDFIKKLSNRGLCNGQRGDVKIYLTVMENIKDGYPIDKIGRKLNRMETLSIIMQGLFQMYMFIYIFGILQNDYNVGNILVSPTKETYINYEILHFPYRYFDYELGDDDCNKEGSVYKVATNGIKLTIIDFDQAKCFHHKYINVTHVDIKEHVIEHAFRFIQTVCMYGDNDVFEICNNHYKTRGLHLINYSKQFFDRYNKERDESSSDYLIDRLRVTFRMWIKELQRKFPDLDKTHIDIC